MSRTLLLEDVLILARTVFGEAEGEPYAGKKAVVHVILNRKQHRIGDRDHSYAQTALRWRQFSVWNEDEPRRKTIERVGFDNPMFRESVRAVLEAFDEADTTQGSRWYHTKDVSPVWSRGKQPVTSIGNHLFFNNIE